MLQKNIFLSLVVTFILALSLLVPQKVLALQSGDSLTVTPGVALIRLFYGDGCPHCKNADIFFK